MDNPPGAAAGGGDQEVCRTVGEEQEASRMQGIKTILKVILPCIV